ncbi:right-handed parallel beta-helix repeat-containing protein [Actibacterium lipolyticum]|uniref:Right handed beta helix domain-containing protein n=1 Tax=Actibacterium lipolyticum TaxID=1524263 RepID=A0A238KUV6_9RHOB|nr:right-handed parallel beta-helix repeat-containing protein [Actibacterium lipolyticum]SMX46487.1 hypothetical protein COL8621_03133 [Actibacterium lipolyticum]
MIAFRLRNFAAALCVLLSASYGMANCLDDSKDQTIVRSAEELRSALQFARGGETFALAPGDYGTLRIMGSARKASGWKSTVTLCSSDADDRARFSGLFLRKVSDLTFDGIEFNYRFAKGQDPNATRPYMVQEARRVAFLNSLFVGDRAAGTNGFEDGFPAAQALFVRDSYNVRIENTEFRLFYRGVILNNVASVVFRNNNLHSLRSDGLNLVSVDNVLIEDNYFHDFERSEKIADHADMIQMWSRGASRASQNIVIRGNTMNSGTGLFSQSIFLRNEVVDKGQAGPEMWYRDITIEDNVIINAQSHGISVGETIGLVIRNNSVLRTRPSRGSARMGAVAIPRINVKPESQNVVIENNVTSAIKGFAGQDGWKVEGNVPVQDESPFAPGYYADMFVAPPFDTVPTLAHFQSLPGGPLDVEKAGATRLAFENEPAEVTPLIRVTRASGRYGYNFDASFSAGPEGFLTQQEGVTFRWKFEGGKEADGPEASYAFEGGGKKKVELFVTMPSGEKYSTKMLLSLDE